MMNQTDRAFVAAYQQSAAGVAGTGRQSSEPIARPKAPLSSYMANRDEVADAGSAKSSTTSTPTVAIASQQGIELASFAWPSMVDRLAAAGEAALLTMIQRLIESSNGPDPISFCGAANGVGVTTLTLAFARIATRAGVSVGLIDAVGGSRGAAASLGVQRAAPISSVGIDAALIASRRDGATLLVASGATQIEAATAVERLTRLSDLVLVDAGPAESARAWMNATTPLLVDRSGPETSLRQQAARLLDNHDGRPVAVIETFTPAA